MNYSFVLYHWKAPQGSSYFLIHVKYCHTTDGTKNYLQIKMLLKFL